MSYRAVFIGGPIDGQERFLNDCPDMLIVEIKRDRLFPSRQTFVSDPGKIETLTYTRLGCYRAFSVYSAYGFEETMEHVWQRYTGEK